MAVEPITRLPYQEANSLQTDVLQNEQLNYFAAWANAVVQTVGDNDPPGSPTDGQRYVIGTSPTGTWSGKAKYLAVYRGGWQFYAPYSGAVVYNLGDGKPYQYLASAWAIYAGVVGPAGPAGDDGSALTTITSSSGVVTIDCAIGDNFTITLSEDVTSVSLSNEPASGHAKNVCLEIIQPSGSAYTFAFPAGWTWPSGIVGTVSSVPNAVDELNLVIRNPSGTKVYRAMLTNGFS